MKRVLRWPNLATPAVPGMKVNLLLALCLATLFAPGTSAEAKSTGPKKGGLRISAAPALYPAFDPAITDYVTRCAPDNSVRLTVSAPPNMRVAVDGQRAQKHAFSMSISLASGQAFSFITAGPAHKRAMYQVRCLPSDFPTWTFQRSGQPQAEFYAIAPFAKTNFRPLPPGVSPNYVALFDEDGVPVWWIKSSALPTDFHPFSNGNVVVTHLRDIGEEHRLDGSLVRTITEIGPGVSSDGHETLLLPNGNYLLLVQRVLSGFDFCGLTNRPILDQGFQEITPGGSLVRQWFSSDHIPMSEVPQAWCGMIVNSPASGAYDVYHMNSLEPDGDDVLISQRHLDAVYRINGGDGSIQWKLGGTPRPESLAILGDPFAATGDAFRGQHDPRLLDDGTVTIHDNGFHPSANRPPRAVRYSIDAHALTATLVEQKNDPGSVETPICCGSARKLPGGDWVISWGSAGLVTEVSAGGSRVFSLTFDDGLFSYRAHPVLPGSLDRAALRAGMDAQHPRRPLRHRP